MNKKKAAAILLLAVVAAFAAGKVFTRKSGPAAGRVELSGTIEVTDAQVSFRASGLIRERLVSEGDKVAAGQLVAVLDSTEMDREISLKKEEARAAEAALSDLRAGARDEEIRAASAEVENLAAKVEELKNGARPEELDSANASLLRARAERERLESDQRRQEDLFKKGTIAAREYEASLAALKMARESENQAAANLALAQKGPRAETIRQAEALLAAKRESLALLKKGARPEALRQAQAKAASANESVLLSENRKNYAEARSPLGGVVLHEHLNAGEYAPAGAPVVTVGDVSNVWLRAYIQETDLGRVKLGQRVSVSSDSYPGRDFTGRVTFISDQAEFTPKNIQTRQERVKLVYRIKVDIPNQGLELKPGMPVDAVIDTGGG